MKNHRCQLADERVSRCASPTALVVSASSRAGFQPRWLHFIARLAGWTAAVALLPAAFALALRPIPQFPITVSPTVPPDIGGGAPNASLSVAANFAWQEFIALNWPAVTQNGSPGSRGTPDPKQKFGAPNYQGPLTWHTYRGKVEIFPGQGVPPGGTATTVGYPLGVSPPTSQIPALALLPNGAGYGYDAPPAYIYQNGPIPPAGAPSATTPWINLDENNEIGLDQIYAGTAAAVPGPIANQVLFLAKANRAEFDYVVPKGWWNANYVPFAQTAAYIQQNKSDPPAGSPTLVSLPNGTIELKAAFRKLAPTENASRFYTTRARYYTKNQNGQIGYVDDTVALISLHIIQKTPTAPYFIFATFEQADTITDAAGNPVEDPNGNFIGTPPPATPFTPNIVSQNATPTSQQTFTPAQSSVQNTQGQLYNVNIPATGLTTGKILVNQRKHAIPPDVIAANLVAHQAIASYMKSNFPPGTTSPWAYYKLVNVQSRPLPGKVPGVDYTQPDAATFYQANAAVETDYNLQVFSGRFSDIGNNNTITDFTGDPTQTPPTGGQPFYNVTFNQQQVNMGGCMGCHGNAQHGGAGFSFILFGGQVAAPDTVGEVNTQAGLAKFAKFFHQP